MATIDLGKIKQVWRGTYNNSTAYTVDDLVEYTDSGITSTYICVANSTGNAPSSSGTAHASWNYVAKGVTDPIPSQSGNSGKALITNGSAVSWGDSGGWTKIASGTGPSSAVTSIDLDNIFSATYHVYKIFIFWTQDDWLKCRVKDTSGTHAGADYIWTGYYSSENNDGSGRYGGNGSGYGIATYYNATDTSGMTCEMTFLNPFGTNETTWTCFNTYRSGGTMYLDMAGSTMTDNTSHHGLSLFGHNGDSIDANNFNYLVLGAKF